MKGCDLEACRREQEWQPERSHKVRGWLQRENDSFVFFAKNNAHEKTMKNLPGEPAEWTFRYSLRQCEFIQIAVCIEGVDFSQVKELLQGLIDEDEADEGGKGLLCEPSDVAHQRASISGNQHQTQQGRPQADASPQRQIGQVVVPDVKGEKEFVGDDREYIIG